MKSNLKFMAGLILMVVVATVAIVVVEDQEAKRLSDNKDAVGGVETYNQQRLEHLLRLRENVHVSDPIVKAREIADIDDQIDRIGKEQIEETGDNLRIERVIK
jgi:hypothetical protein